MGRTWDAYDMDPCYGGCGGRDAVTQKMRNKKTGEVKSISICNGYFNGQYACNLNSVDYNISLLEWEPTGK